MQDMMKMYGMTGMDPSMFGGQETLILNANHPLVQYVVDHEGSENTSIICKQLYDLAMLAHKPLNSEEMTAFVKRSNEIMMMALWFSIKTIQSMNRKYRLRGESHFMSRTA